VRVLWTVAPEKIESRRGGAPRSAVKNLLCHSTFWL